MNELTQENFRVFTLIRVRDETGVSGTGPVVNGVMFPSGRVVISWNTKISSIAIYESFEDFLKVHVLSHPGNGSQIIWADAGKNELTYENY